MEILKITDNDDGSATLDFEITSFEKRKIKEYLRVKRLTSKRLSTFVQNAIIAYAVKKGYKE